MILLIFTRKATAWDRKSGYKTDLRLRIRQAVGFQGVLRRLLPGTRMTSFQMRVAFLLYVTLGFRHRFASASSVKA